MKIYAVGAEIYSFSSNGKISKFDSRSKNITPVSELSKDFGSIISISYSDSANAFYLYTDKKKLAKVDLTTNTITDVTIGDTTGAWEEAVSMATFSSNIYLLDSAAGQIWKHSVVDAGYSKGVAYLSKPTIPIKDSRSLIIDGDVYVLKSDGSVVKISKGVENTSFAISAPPTPDNKITDGKKILTTADSNSLYILDAGSNRVLEYTKTGSYKRQFVANTDLKLTDFTLNSKLKKLWLISANKVFELDL